MAQGIPVINLLNIKKIVADYSMPFDATVRLSAGESPVYFTASYPKHYIALSFAVAVAMIASNRFKMRK